MLEIQSMSVDGETQRGSLVTVPFSLVKHRNNSALVNIDGEYSDGLSVELAPLLFSIIFRIKARVHSAALTQTWSILRLIPICTKPSGGRNFWLPHFKVILTSARVFILLQTRSWWWSGPEVPLKWKKKDSTDATCAAVRCAPFESGLESPCLCDMK